MAKYVAFLRAINVGGRIVKMDALRKSFERLGFDDVDTFIASGNVLFSSRAKDTVKLARQIEKQLLKDLGYEVSTFIRTVDEVIGVSGYQAFPPKDVAASTALNVGFLEAPLGKESCASLECMASSIDRFHVNGREWYWLSRAKQSESKISNGAIEKALKVRSTLRGMNTIVRLAARLGPQPGPKR